MKNYKKRLNQNIDSENQCCEDPCIDIRDGNKVCLSCGMVYGIQLVMMKEGLIIKRKKKSESELNRDGENSDLERCFL